MRWVCSILLLGPLSRLDLAAAEAKVKLSDLPPPAQKTIQAQLKGAKLGEITKSIEDAQVFYDVEMTTKGKTRSFTVSEEGVLVALQVFLPETPRPVQQAIRAQVGKQKLGDIFKYTEDGETTYEVEMGKAERTRSFTLSQEGKLLEMEMFIEETPAIIQKAIEKELRGGTLEQIQKTFEDDEVNYDVDLTRNGKSFSLTFDSNGALVYQAEPIRLSEAPEAVQKTLKLQLADAKLARLEKTTEDGDITYEAELVKAGRRRSLSIRPNGQIAPAEL